MNNGGSVLSALAAYAALRLTIRAFHKLRRRALRRLLLDLLPPLDAAGTTHWLDYGSLLGLHRDGELILYDNDIDLVVMDPDWPRLHEHLSAALPQDAVRVLTPSEDATVRFVRVYTPLGFADVYGARFSTCGARVVVELGHDDEATALPAAAVLPLRRIAFRGAAIPAPRDVEAVLAARYGSDWRTPRYMDKGADTVEAAKLYARIFRGLAWAGIQLVSATSQRTPSADSLYRASEKS